MQLAEQRQVLESMGFRVLEEQADQLVAVRSRWHLECMLTKLTYVVFVRRVGVLTAAEIDADRERLAARARSLDPSALPRGFQKGVAVLTVYLAERVEPDARALCARKPQLRFAFFYLPAARDASAGESFYLRSTPAWGMIYYGKFRHLVRRLLDPALSGGEPLSISGLVITLLFLACTAAAVGLMFVR
jgi:hypothetical protein